jgi:hypothetical protein
MAIIEKQKQNSSPNINGEEFSLSKSELEFLLLLIKDSTFKGIQVEDVYNTVYKLQKQYTNIK